MTNKGENPGLRKIIAELAENAAHQRAMEPILDIAKWDRADVASRQQLIDEIKQRLREEAEKNDAQENAATMSRLYSDLIVNLAKIIFKGNQEAKLANGVSRCNSNIEVALEVNNYELKEPKQHGLKAINVNEILKKNINSSGEGQISASLFKPSVVVAHFWKDDIDEHVALQNIQIYDNYFEFTYYPKEERYEKVDGEIAREVYLNCLRKANTVLLESVEGLLKAEQ